jgi:hypothetical protein
MLSDPQTMQSHPTGQHIVYATAGGRLLLLLVVLGGGGGVLRLWLLVLLLLLSALMMLVLVLLWADLSVGAALPTAVKVKTKLHMLGKQGSTLVA